MRCLAPGAVILTDDGGEFERLVARGYRHQPLAMRRSRTRMDSLRPMVSTVTANLKSWLVGTFHGVSPQHLQAYLDEFPLQSALPPRRVVQDPARTRLDPRQLHRNTPSKGTCCGPTG